MDFFQHYRQSAIAHFDIPRSTTELQQYITNPDKVAKHAFYPFIVKTQSLIKVKRQGEKLKRYKKKRSVCIPAHLDRAIYAYYAHQLSTLYEAQLLKLGISSNILAFRALNKKNTHFALECFQAIARLQNCLVIAIDFSSFFDTLLHTHLKYQWQKLLNMAQLPADHYSLFKSITHYATVERLALYRQLGLSPYRSPKTRLCNPRQFRTSVRQKGLIQANPRHEGIPQGIALGNLLSNIYMIDFDLFFSDYTQKHHGHYYRYCDDILIILPSNPTNSQYLLDEITSLINKQTELAGLKIHPDKSEHFIFHHGTLATGQTKSLQYLGFNYDGRQITIRSSSISKYLSKMRRGVSLARQTQFKYNKIRKLKKLPDQALYTRALYSRFSHTGQRNFIRYALDAAKTMNSTAIRQQIKPFMNRLNQEIQPEINDSLRKV